MLEKKDAQLFLLYKSLTVQAELEPYGLVRISYHRVLPSSKKRLLWMTSLRGDDYPRLASQGLPI